MKKATNIIERYQELSPVQALSKDQDDEFLCTCI